MGLDRLLNIYQAYTITKISAYNKQMLIAHYAQCEKIGELQQQIKVANSVSRNILKNQLKEIELREEQKFYKGLAFNMNEVYEKISSITDTNLQTFYSNLLLSKILENLKECQDNLDEINDKEYCKKLQNKCNAFLNNITRRTQYTDSPLNKLLIFEQDYKNKVAERRILLRNKKSELAQYKKRLDTIHKKDILSKKLKKRIYFRLHNLTLFNVSPRYYCTSKQYINKTSISNRFFYFVGYIFNPIILTTTVLSKNK